MVVPAVRRVLGRAFGLADLYVRAAQHGDAAQRGASAHPAIHRLAADRGVRRVIATAFTLAQAPTLIVMLALAAFGWIEPADVPVGLHGPWPLAEAIGAGAVVGMVLSGLQAPLSVGLLTFFYDVLAPAEDDRVPAAPIEEAPPAPPVAEGGAAATRPSRTSNRSSRPSRSGSGSPPWKPTIRSVASSTSPYRPLFTPLRAVARPRAGSGALCS